MHSLSARRSSEKKQQNQKPAAHPCGNAHSRAAPLPPPMVGDCWLLDWPPSIAAEGLYGIHAATRDRRRTAVQCGGGCIDTYRHVFSLRATALACDRIAARPRGAASLSHFKLSLRCDIRKGGEPALKRRRSTMNVSVQRAARPPEAVPVSEFHKRLDLLLPMIEAQANEAEKLGYLTDDV